MIEKQSSTSQLSPPNAHDSDTVEAGLFYHGSHISGSVRERSKKRKFDF